MPTYEIITATTPEHFAVGKRLFQAYADGLGIDLCFQNFTAELEHLPTMYGPPEGRLLLAHVDGAWAGCVGVRALPHGAAGRGVCEMKRLYVPPAYRGRGVGRALAEAVVDAGRALGYRSMRLDTLQTMQVAQDLYRTLGFRVAEPYYDNPNTGVVYMELRYNGER